MVTLETENALIAIEQILNALRPGRYVWLLSEFRGEPLQLEYDADFPEGEPYYFLTDERLRRIVEDRGLLFTAGALTAFPADLPQEEILAYGVPGPLRAACTDPARALHPLAEAEIALGERRSVNFLARNAGIEQHVSEVCRKKSGSRARRDRQRKGLLFAALALFLLAAACSAAVAVAAVILGGGLLPYGAACCAMAGSSAALACLYFTARAKTRPGVRRAFRFLPRNGFSHTSQRWDGVRRHGYAKGKLGVAVFVNRRVPSDNYAEVTFDRSAAFPAYLPLSDCGVGTREELRRLRERSGREEELAASAEFLQKNLSALLERAESGEAVPVRESSRGLPEEYFRLDAAYERIRLFYRIVIMLLAVGAAAACSAVMIVFIPLRQPVFIGLFTVVTLAIGWLAWRAGGAIAEYLSARLGDIALREEELAEGLERAPRVPDPFDESKSPAAFSRQVAAPFAPAPQKRGRRIAGGALAGLGALLITAACVAALAVPWLFPVLFFPGCWLAACGALLSANKRPLVAFSLSTLYLAALGLPVLIAYFCVGRAGLKARALGFSVSVLCGALALYAAVAVTVLLARRPPRSSLDERRSFWSEDGRTEYFYAGAFRVGWTTVPEAHFVDVEAQENGQFLLLVRETFRTEPQAYARVAALVTALPRYLLQNNGEERRERERL